MLLYGFTEFTRSIIIAVRPRRHPIIAPIGPATAASVVPAVARAATVNDTIPTAPLAIPREALAIANSLTCKKSRILILPVISPVMT